MAEYPQAFRGQEEKQTESDEPANKKARIFSYPKLLFEKIWEMVESQATVSRMNVSYKVMLCLIKDVFFVVMYMGQRKSFELSWGIEPQTFGFIAPILYHRAIDTPYAGMNIRKVANFCWALYAWGTW